VRGREYSITCLCSLVVFRALASSPSCHLVGVVTSVNDGVARAAVARGWMRRCGVSDEVMKTFQNVDAFLIDVCSHASYCFSHFCVVWPMPGGPCVLWRLPGYPWQVPVLPSCDVAVAGCVVPEGWSHEPRKWGNVADTPTRILELAALYKEDLVIVVIAPVTPLAEALKIDHRGVLQRVKRVYAQVSLEREGLLRVPCLARRQCISCLSYLSPPYCMRVYRETS